MRKWNDRRKPEERTISFGRYRGHLYTQVPTKYLEWLVSLGWGNWVDRKRWATEELNRRKRLNIM